MDNTQLPRTNEGIVLMVMKNPDCQSSKSISMDAKRLFDYTISPASVSGVLRKLVAAGVVANSRNEFGTTIYWLVDDSKSVRVEREGVRKSHVRQ